MNEGLKQRVIGAFVLLALGVIFLPVLFEPEYRKKVDRESQIPEPPVVQSVVVAEPVARENIEAAQPAAQMYALGSAPEAAATTPAAALEPAAQSPPDRTILDAKGVARAWAVQVATFSEAQRAVALRDQLLEDGYPAFSRATSSASGVLTRVYVGPKIDRQKAIQLKLELDQALKLETLVVVFSP